MTRVRRRQLGDPKHVDVARGRAHKGNQQRQPVWVPEKGGSLELAREQVLEYVREAVGEEGILRAREQLPERVDTDRDAELLSGLGVDAFEVASQFNGGRQT